MSGVTFEQVVLTRRQFSQGLMTVFGLTAGGCQKQGFTVTVGENLGASFDFPNLPPTLNSTHQVSEGYIVERLISWGDPLFNGQGGFDWKGLTGEEQERRFGYNNDFLALIEHDGHWLLTVNHESTSAQLMFEGEERYTSTKPMHTPIEMAAHGLSVLEIKQADSGSWNLVLGSRFNRRITLDTEMRISGPCAGYSRLQTPEDPTGTVVKGTMHNCSGGLTPWGTILTCEENILYYFSGDQVDEEEKAAYKRYNIGYSKA